MKKLFTIILLLFAAYQALAQEYRLPETKYDWSELAGSIVGASSDKHEQSYKIYRWICDNIEYDVNHRIYTADECIEQKKGVCQAYSELFYRLADAVGLESEVVVGYSKNPDGSLDAMGHAWVTAYMEDGSSILIDPTWGAGSIMNGVFLHVENDDTWFDVDPEWMIFTHLPSGGEYQKLEDQVDSLTFMDLPYFLPAYEEFGQDGKELLDLSLKGELPQLPVYYPQFLSFVEIGGIPVEKELRIGNYYDFAFRMKTDTEMMIKNGQCSYQEWKEQPDNHISYRFMPAEAGDLHIGILMPDGRWQAVVTYTVAEPTAEDIARLEKNDPSRSPLLNSLENYVSEWWLERGVGPEKILEYVRANGAVKLPTIYSQLGYEIVDIPLNGELHVRQPYTFSILPKEGLQWAMLNNNNWFTEWTRDEETGILTITVEPNAKGTLRLIVQTELNGPFHYCLEYKVVK